MTPNPCRINKSEEEHREFLKQYVLNRASAHIGGLKSCCVEQAEKAWLKIIKLTSEGVVDEHSE